MINGIVIDLDCCGVWIDLSGGGAGKSIDSREIGTCGAGIPAVAVSNVGFEACPVRTSCRVGVRHIAVAVFVAVISVAVGIYAISKGIRVVVGLDIWVRVVALLLLHPAVTIAVEIAEIIGVGVEGVRLVEITIGIGTVIANIVCDSWIDVRRR